VLYFEFFNQLAGLAIRVCSWPAMVTGQSLVLYSRLGVVLGRGHEKLLRVLLWVIILDAVINHGGTISMFIFGRSVHDVETLRSNCRLLTPSPSPDLRLLLRITRQGMGAGLCHSAQSPANMLHNPRVRAIRPVYLEGTTDPSHLGHSTRTPADAAPHVATCSYQCSH